MTTKQITGQGTRRAYGQGAKWKREESVSLLVKWHSDLGAVERKLQNYENAKHGRTPDGRHAYSQPLPEKVYNLEQTEQRLQRRITEYGKSREPELSPEPSPGLSLSALGAYSQSF